MPDKRKGGDGTWTYRDWTLAIDGGAHDGQLIDIRANARVAGPASKQYALISGFLGRTPEVGEVINVRTLIGREAFAKIVSTDAGWPKVETVIAKPQTTRAPAPATPPAPAPVAAPVAAAQPEEPPRPAQPPGDGLPY